MSQHFEKYNPGRHGSTPECRDNLRLGWKIVGVLGIIFLIIGVIMVIGSPAIGAVLLALGAVFLGIGALIFRASQRWQALLSALPTEGIVTAGVVLSATASQQQNQVQQGGNMRNRGTTTTRTNKIHVRYQFTDDQGVQRRRNACWISGQQQRHKSAFAPNIMNKVLNVKDDMAQARQGWNDWQNARNMIGKQCLIAFTKDGSVFLNTLG